LCKWTTSQQDESGFFRVYPESKSVFTHTHCYAIEGLLYAYGYLSDQIFLKSALKGVSWLIQIQKKYNIISDWIHDGKITKSIDSSSIAQFARILYITDAVDERKDHQITYKDVLKTLAKMQYVKTESPDKLGGFYLFEKDFKLFKFKISRLYSWPTMFAISTLTLPYYEEKATPLDLW